jgi:hypothetical protein
MAITAQELIDAAAFSNAAYSDSNKSVWEILADLKSQADFESQIHLANSLPISISDHWTVNANTVNADTTSSTTWFAEPLGVSGPLGGAHQGLMVADTVVRTEVAGTDDQGFYRFVSLLPGGVVEHSVAAISAVKDSTFMLAFRGSDPPYVDDYNDAINDPQGHYAELQKLISDVVQYVKSHPAITKLIVTGHSLGGQMAQLFAEKMSQLSVSEGLAPSMVDILPLEALDCPAILPLK